VEDNHLVAGLRQRLRPGPQGHGDAGALQRTRVVVDESQETSQTVQMRVRDGGRS
jgi:hypothetical protein